MLKLLIVEDDPLIRNLLARRLSREGFQICSASNGVQAIALARCEQPALILLDIDLPILDGWQTAQRLRALPETRAIPIVVLTGALAEERHAQLARAGCEAYALKPINFPQLIAHIRWLTRSEASTGWPAPAPLQA